MSWVIIAVAAIFIVFGIIGWKKGIIRIAVSLAAMIITLIVCVGVTPVLCSAVRQNTTLYDKLRESVYNFMIEDESFNEAADESIEDSENAVVESDKLEEYSAAIEHYAAAVMQKLHLPDSVVTQPAEAAAGAPAPNAASDGPEESSRSADGPSRGGAGSTPAAPERTADESPDSVRNDTFRR